MPPTCTGSTGAATGSAPWRPCSAGCWRVEATSGNEWCLRAKGASHRRFPTTPRPPTSARRWRPRSNASASTPSTSIELHRPDLLTHPSEVAETLVALQDEGKIGLIGISNFTPSQHRALALHLGADHPIATTQPQYSASRPRPAVDGTFDLCMEEGVAVPIVWSPLAGGSLATGERDLLSCARVLDRLAEREGVDRATLAVGLHPRPSRRGRWPSSVANPRAHRVADRAAEVSLTATTSTNSSRPARAKPLPCRPLIVRHPLAGIGLSSRRMKSEPHRGGATPRTASVSRSVARSRPHPRSR